MPHLMQQHIDDLAASKQLLRIKEEVDPHLVMASIHLRVHAQQGPAILYENVKGSKYRAVSNLFGTIARSRFLLRHQWRRVEQAVALRANPMAALRHPLQYARTGLAALNALPRKVSFNTNDFEEIKLEDLPQIHHWPMDGGSFVTLPQVYTEAPAQPGILHANLGMYRIQLCGNDYISNAEAGLHYQLHRGIGIHHTQAQRAGLPLQVSCFVGGHAAHSLAAVMPLPEGLSEMTFAGLMAGRRFRYAYDPAGNAVSMDADFVLTGEVLPGENKDEGPFGDHLGYYSLAHPFPLLRIKKVYARKRGIWAFTVVGRPPQEDTAFGALIHELTGAAVQQEIPGVQEVHAVDAAGVHPLLLAIGSERYTPYLGQKRPAEILTQAHRILGTGQLSLAKYLFILAPTDGTVSTSDEYGFLQYFLERVVWERDLHFSTRTTIDTLDYSGTDINSGSKLVLAAYSDRRRVLGTTVPTSLQELGAVRVMPGILALSYERFTDYKTAAAQLSTLTQLIGDRLSSQEQDAFPLIVLCDEPAFAAAHINNFVWVAFTRSNPSHDVYGVNSFESFKHWGCHGPLVIDARAKPHHAPVLKEDPEAAHIAAKILDGYGF